MVQRYVFTGGVELSIQYNPCALDKVSLHGKWEVVAQFKSKQQQLGGAGM